MEILPEGPVNSWKFEEQFAPLVEQPMVVDEPTDGYAASPFSAMTAEPTVRYEQPKTCLSQFRTVGLAWRAGAA